MNTKLYHFIVSGSTFSLSNETDADPMSDYSPGIWSIKTYKKAIEYAKRYLAEGHTIVVTAYNEREHETANKAIQDLGLNQELFKIPDTLPVSQVDNGKPKTLAELKRYLILGKKIRIISGMELEQPQSRETEILKVQSNAIVSRKGTDGKTWLEFGQAKQWIFDNQGATIHYLSQGVYKPSVRIEYLD